MTLQKRKLNEASTPQQPPLAPVAHAAAAAATGMTGLQAISSATEAPSPEAQAKPVQKTVKDYVELIETVARVEYSRLPHHLVDYSELVNIGAIAIHVLLTSNPGTEFNVTYMSTAMKWAIRNELRYRYKWYAFRQVTDTVEEGPANNNATTPDGGDDEGFAVDRHQVREAVYETILSVDSLMEADNPHEIRDEAFTPCEQTEVKELAQAIREAIVKLPPREKQIIEARFYKNMKMREIGSTFGISPSRISRIVQSGLDKIKADLTRRGYLD